MRAEREAYPALIRQPYSLPQPLVLLLAPLTQGLLSITVSWVRLDGTEMPRFTDWVQRIVTFRAGLLS